MRERPCGRTVIVSGVPRSGTSLMMQMLEAGGLPILSDAARAPDADNPRGYYEFEPAKRIGRDRAWLERARGGAVKLAHSHLRELPRDRSFRVILMRRRLEEVVRSQAAMLARRGEPEGPLSASRWVEIYARELAELVRWVEADPHFALLEVDYGALLRDPVAGARAVNAFLGGDLDVAAMARRVDPALHRQRSS